MKSHVAIFDAINMSDPARAEEAMLRAVMNGKASLLRAPAGGSLVDGTRGRKRQAQAALSMFHIRDRDPQRRRQ